jgi:hypothetical protein
MRGWLAEVAGFELGLTVSRACSHQGGYYYCASRLKDEDAAWRNYWLNPYYLRIAMS